MIQAESFLKKMRRPHGKCDHLTLSSTSENGPPFSLKPIPVGGDSISIFYGQHHDTNLQQFRKYNVRIQPGFSIFGIDGSSHQLC
jgi:hypothetical protein